MLTADTMPADTRPDVAVFDAMESEVRLYCRAFPVVFDRAKGAELYTEDGRAYLDFFCGAGALNYGHNLDYVKERVAAYLNRDGLMHGLDLHTSAKREFLTRLREVILVPRGLDHKVQFCGPTGANAVEAALKLARKVTGRRTIVSFFGAFHGMSAGALAATGARQARAAAGVPLPDVVFLPYEKGPAANFDSLALLEAMLADPASGVEKPAAVIVEAVQMDGGIYPASSRWLRELRELTRRHGILLICDEIQAGCGRTGRFFAFESAGIVPDLITASKSLSGYGFPLSVVLLRPELDVWEPGEHTGTFRGNQIAFVSAAAVLDLWEQPEFLNHLAVVTRRMEEFGRELAAATGIEVRQAGAVLGIDTTGAGGADRTAGIQRRCFEDGVIIERCGRDDQVVKVVPPITIEAGQLEKGLAVIQRAVARS